MSKEVAGVGIIGFGPNTAASTFHVPLIMSDQRLKLLVVSSTLELDSIRGLLPKDVHLVSTADEVINNESVDLVVVATPNAWHFEYAKKALEAGKHVVVEKPLAITSNDIDKLIALAKEKKLVLSQFHNRRWDGAFLTMIKLLQEGRLGEINKYDANYDRPLPEGWRTQPSPGAGSLYDLGIHMIDQVIALFGRPLAVSAKVRAQKPGSKVDDYFKVQLDYGKLQVALGSDAFAEQPGPRYKVIGTKGTYVKYLADYGADPQAGMLNKGIRPGDDGWAEDSPEAYGLLTTGDSSDPYPTEKGSYETFYAGIADAILHGKDQPVPVEDARDVVAIIEAAFKSEKEGRSIPYEEINFLVKPKIGHEK